MINIQNTGTLFDSEGNSTKELEHGKSQNIKINTSQYTVQNDVIKLADFVDKPSTYVLDMINKQNN